MYPDKINISLFKINVIERFFFILKIKIREIKCNLKLRKNCYKQFFTSFKKYNWKNIEFIGEIASKY